MNTTAPSLELHALEKLREEELEEARAIQSVMLPAESLRAGAVTISHEFQPVAAVGGDFLDYFQLTDGSVGLYLGDVSGKGPANGCRNLKLCGIPPGLFAAANYETLTLRLLAGDSVLFCTDGISDAFNRKEEQFGIERLQEICAAPQFAAPTELLGQVFAAVENFSRGQEQQDDMAAALFHFCS